MPHGLTPEQFIAIWQTSASLDEAARRVGKPKLNVSVTATKYRKRGIPMKFMTGRGFSHLDVARLSGLARSYAPPSQEGA